MANHPGETNKTSDDLTGSSQAFVTSFESAGRPEEPVRRKKRHHSYKKFLVPAIVLLLILGAAAAGYQWFIGQQSATKSAASKTKPGSAAVDAYTVDHIDPDVGGPLESYDYTLGVIETALVNTDATLSYKVGDLSE